MRNTLSKGLFAVYVVIIVWLVLFKLKFNLGQILQYDHRSLNLIPFAAPKIVDGQINYREMILNCIFFIPLGLLSRVNFKHTQEWVKLLLIFGFSISLEIIQFIFAIGATDITDVIMNTIGGIIGMRLYKLSSKILRQEKLDLVIISVGTVLFALFVAVLLSR